VPLLLWKFIFSQFFLSFLSALKGFGIFRLGLERSQLQFYIHNLRDYTKINNKTTDDTPYGGGAGMVMMVEPIVRGVEAIESDFGPQFKVFTSPQGVKFNEDIAKFLSSKIDFFLSLLTMRELTKGLWIMLIWKFQLVIMF